MTESDYQKLFDHLNAATRVLTSNQGELAEGDIRIRHLVSMSTAETRRQLGDFQRRRGTTRRLRTEVSKSDT
jgi:hypothetical protein